MFSVIYAEKKNQKTNNPPPPKKNNKKRGFKYEEKSNFLRFRAETLHLKVIQNPAVILTYVCMYVYASLSISAFPWNWFRSLVWNKLGC